MFNSTAACETGDGGAGAKREAGGRGGDEEGDGGDRAHDCERK